MITDRSGFSRPRYEDNVGHQLHIPYRIVSQGFMLFAPADDIALVVLPVSSIEDPRFLLWLGRKGIYRLEDAEGSRARIGEGCVIARLRSHRAKPTLLPGTVSAAFGLSAEWPFLTRRYLEARTAASWVEEGNVLTNRTFNWTILNFHSAEFRRQLDRRHDALQQLLMTSERIMDNDADEFVERPAGAKRPEGITGSSGGVPAVTEIRLRQTRHARHTRQFPVGSRLRFDDGCISATATVRRDGVVLHPGSTVYRQAGPQAGRNFRIRHRDFLALTASTDEGERGTTRVTVIADSAAFLIKNVTGARVHVASRWQLV